MIEVPKNSVNPITLKKPVKHLKGEAKWKDIEDLINRWAKRNPRGAAENMRWVQEAKADLTDKKFATSNAEAIGRFGVSIHPELMNYIQAFYPEFMDSKDDLHEFMKRFKQFRVPEVV